VAGKVLVVDSPPLYKGDATRRVDVELDGRKVLYYLPAEDATAIARALNEWVHAPQTQAWREHAEKKRYARKLAVVAISDPDGIKILKAPTGECAVDLGDGGDPTWYNTLGYALARVRQVRKKRAAKLAVPRKTSCSLCSEEVSAVVVCATCVAEGAILPGAGPNTDLPVPGG
jgi:hypothetical protein